MKLKKTTEAESPYTDLSERSTFEILKIINHEDQTVAQAVSHAIPLIEGFVTSILPKIQQGGRLIYLGSGTSGRLGIVDASECPPTFGVGSDVVLGIIAGGDGAIRTAVEHAEDSPEQGARDLDHLKLQATDVLFGISTSGTTPYVLGALKHAQKMSCTTGSFFCNTVAPIAQYSDHPICVVVGPEVISGSTRMKAGTATKMVLNMISTCLMIRLGHVVGNRMIDMKISNQKLIDRGVRMIMDYIDCSESQAKASLEKYGNVRRAIEAARGIK